MIALDDGDRTTGFEDSHQCLECSGRVAQMLQHETHEDVIEVGRYEGQVEDVGAGEGHIGDPRLLRLSPSLSERFSGDVDGGKGRPWAVTSQDDRLRAHPAARLQHPACRRIASAGVQ